MLRQVITLVVAILLFLFAVDYISREQDSLPAQDRQTDRADTEAGAPTGPSPGTRNYVADISAHTPQQLQLLFEGVEQLVDRPRSEQEQPLVSLVLHGPEVAFFAFRNYPKYKDIVDRAAKLAALRAVDISICQTQMRALGIGSDEVPAFLHQVPYGPDQVRRLLEQGYVSM